MGRKVVSTLVGVMFIASPLVAFADTPLPSGFAQQIAACLTPPSGTTPSQINDACTAVIQTLSVIVSQLTQLFGAKQTPSNGVTFTPAPWWYNSYAQATTSVKTPPSITALSTSSAPIGTLVTVRGTNFTQTGDIVFFNDQVAASVATSDSTLLMFYVPSTLRPVCQVGQACTQSPAALVPGSYSVAISNANGKSNTMQFAVVAPATSTTTPPTASSTLTFSASPTSGPAPLSVSFTMNALGSIAFGDGQSGTTTAANGSCTNSIPASCTFSVSHSYASAGTYTAVFSASGTSTTKSATITATSTTSTSGSSCTTPWGSYSVQDGGMISYQPYFSNGTFTLSVVIPLMRCSSGTWLQCDYQGNGCAAYGGGSDKCSSRAGGCF